MRLDPAETDLAWRGYSGWALLPSFLLTLCITLAIPLLDWWLDPEYHYVDSIFLGIGMIGLWLFQLARWCYRGITYTYRLTHRHLFVDRGFLHLPEAPIVLATVREVRVERKPLQRWLEVGTVRIITADHRKVKLTGLWRPDGFAALLREQIKSEMSV